MKRLTISLEDEQYDELVNEADRRGVSKSKVAREIFARWLGSSQDSHNEFTSGEGVVKTGGEEPVKSGEDIVNRLDDLEARVGELETTTEWIDYGDADETAEPSGAISTGVDARTREEAAAEPDPETVEPPTVDTGTSDPYTLAEAYDVAGRDKSEDVREDRHAALVAVLDELQNGPAKSGDLKPLFEEHPGGFDSARSWWSNLVHPFLKSARDAGALGYRDSNPKRHHYFHLGDDPAADSDEGGVYDPTDEFNS